MLANSTHYLVRHIDFYQVNNSVNIDIHAIAANIPTTIKVVVNGIITTGVVNDPNYVKELFLDNCHVCPELLAILEENLNVLAGGTCWRNRKGFPLNTIVLLYQEGVKGGPPNAFTIVSSVLLLHNGKIQIHPNSSAVSVN